jgi:hypothetical protein
MSHVAADPTNPEFHVCPERRGAHHHLAISGPMHHRILRCAHCGKAESTLRAEIAQQGVKR